ncbi:MAG: serpin family protein [Firmicutes bacterium]|nr:serpin family protein [Bacillota bacterium]
MEKQKDDIAVLSANREKAIVKTSVIAWVLVLCMLLSFAACGNKAAEETEEVPEKPTVISDYSDGVKVVAAAYPEAVAKDMDAAAYAMGSAEYMKWVEDYFGKMEEAALHQDGMTDFYKELQSKIMAPDKDGNIVCSPLNIYIAAAMLAEVSDGNTRTQVLDALHAGSMDELRSRIKALWDVNYLNTPTVKSILANSMWLRNDMEYNEDTLGKLADIYYASSFSGKMGSEEMNEALRKWTDEATGGLLKDYVKDMSLNEMTVLALVSTLYYKAAWTDNFSADRTYAEVFHGTEGDKEVPMMHKDGTMSVYDCDNFIALGLGLNDSGTMFFFLPKDGIDPASLAADAQAMSLVREPGSVESIYPIVHLTVPKFEVSSKTDLCEVFKVLGMTDAFDRYSADFSNLTDAIDEIWLDSAEHAAMVKIDEEGVTGAAYTELAFAGSGLPQNEIDFKVDRPFYFVVSSRDGALLFSGVVRNVD